MRSLKKYFLRHNKHTRPAEKAKPANISNTAKTPDIADMINIAEPTNVSDTSNASKVTRAHALYRSPFCFCYLLRDPFCRTLAADWAVRAVISYGYGQGPLI